MNDLISRKALIAEYDRVHIGEPGKARKLIEDAPAVREWIPVSEPPKEKGCYLATVKHWLDGKPVTREAFWNSVDWLSCEKRQEITPRVTHWMPLPEPPKEGKL